MNAIAIEDDSIRAVFDGDTGRLVELVAPATGWRIQARHEMGLSFRMLVPMDGRRNNQIIGESHGPASVRVTDGGRCVEFTWTNLRSQHGPEVNITFVGRARLTDLGLEFSGTVDNGSPGVIESVVWPALGDLAPPAPGARLDRISMIYSQYHNTVQLWPNMPNVAGYFGTEYPTNFAANHLGAPFVLVQAAGQGLYVGHHEHTMRELLAWFFEIVPGLRDDWDGSVPVGGSIGPHASALRMFCVHQPFIAARERYELAPVVLQTYRGDWRQGTDCYRSWRKTWFRRPVVPAWADDVHSWQQIQMNDPEDSLYYRYGDLPAIAAQCRDAGVAAIQLVGWNIGGQDRGNPLHDTDPALGTRQELERAIDESHRMGVRMVLFSKFTWGDASQEWYRRGGHAHAVRDPYGDPYPPTTYHYETWTQLLDLNGRRLVPLCHASPAWRDAATAEFHKTLDYGAAGILYDECQHHGHARCCFAEGHAHRRGAFVFEGDLPLARQFSQAAHAAGRNDYLLAGESPSDTLLQGYHVSYFRINSRARGQMQRYIDPRAQLMVAVTGHDARNQLVKCLQYRYVISYEPRNFKGLLREFPLTLAYGRRVDDLRRRYRQWLWDAEFRDTLGCEVRCGGDRHEDYAVFVRPDEKRAVVIANADESPRQAKVDLPGPVGPLSVVSPDRPDEQPSGGTLVIPPRGVAVLLER